MNKLETCAVSVLVAIVGCLGWFAAHYDGSNDQFGSFYRVKLPPPTIRPEAVRVEQALVAAAAARADAALKINGKQIVVTSRDMLNPERHDAAHVMARAEYKLTQ